MPRRFRAVCLDRLPRLQPGDDRPGGHNTVQIAPQKGGQSDFEAGFLAYGHTAGRNRHRKYSRQRLDHRGQPLELYGRPSVNRSPARELQFCHQR